ncbi:hypothetical protein OQA88_6655 [Cercophora sp. LCS_1]
MPHPIRHHRRQPSEASSLARSSTESSRPSTRGTDLSVEWDPLRLHPPLAPGPAPVFPPTNTLTRHGVRQAQSMHFPNSSQLISQNPSRTLHSHSQSTPSVVIYDGFDFGFGQKLSSPIGSEAASPDSCRGAEWGDSAPAVTPRPHRATEGADYFMKRGDWKRRGIVFSNSTPMASEDECFDLDVGF